MPYIDSQKVPTSMSSNVPLFRASRKTLRRSFLHDAGALLSVLQHLSQLVTPFETSYMTFPSTRELLLQTWLSVLAVVFLIISIPVVMLLPGMLSITIAILGCALIYVLSWPLQGPELVKSDVSVEPHDTERWLFVSGYATRYDFDPSFTLVEPADYPSHAGLQTNINCISQTFGRAVTGVHNQRYINFL